MGEIMIAKGRRVIAQPVQRADRRVDVMRPQPGGGQFVAKGRSVQQVAIVEQHQVGMGGAFLGDQRRQTRQPAAPRLCPEVHVQIGGGQNPQADGGRAFRRSKAGLNRRGTSVWHRAPVTLNRGRHGFVIIVGELLPTTQPLIVKGKSDKMEPCEDARGSIPTSRL